MRKNSLISTLLLGIFFLASFPITTYSDENEKFLVCIDAGHQEKGDSRGEPISPDSGNRKARVSSGTAGVATKNPEYVINLQAAEILKQLLEESNYEVLMTRETHKVNISNIERSEIANKANADMTIRIHCDGSNDTSKSGCSILIPAKEKITENIYDSSKSYATILKDKLVENNIKVNGIFERNDITGFNWSRVPVVILEMGFMSNYSEDKMLADETYQNKLMQCVREALDTYKEEA